MIVKLIVILSLHVNIAIMPKTRRKATKRKAVADEGTTGAATPTSVIEPLPSTSNETVTRKFTEEVAGSFTVPSDIPAYYRPLSLRLFKVMDEIGASEKVRKLRIETSVTAETLGTMAWQPEMSMYRFGSSADGTTTPGMESDVDKVYILNNLPVVTDPSQQPVGKSFLIIQDSTIPAGYCELRLVQDGVLQDPDPDNFYKDQVRFAVDVNNRLVSWFNPDKTVVNKYWRRHGPALSTDATAVLAATDRVFAVQCKDLPDCTREWQTRERHFNWPSPDTIRTFQTYGSLFVPVGHPLSKEREKQCRISLSHQEKSLVTKFNSIQHKCFILLKIINKEIIHYQVPDSLSSYHIKTCMFYMLENTPGEFWEPEMLLSSVNACMNKLLEWVRKGYCPNYFIPEENMFDGRINDDVRSQLQRILEQLLADDFKFLISIKCDRLGDRFKQSLLPPRITTGADYQNGHDDAKLLKLKLFGNVVFSCFQTGIIKLRKTCTKDVQTTLEQLFNSVRSLQRSSTITRHTNEETLKAKLLLLPYLELALMTNSVAFAVSQGKSSEEIQPLLSSIRWNDISMASDSFSSKLKQASLLYTRGQYLQSLYVLSTLAGLIRFTFCICHSDRGKYTSPTCATLLEATYGISEVTPEYLLKKVFIPCVYFLPTEKTVIPDALGYEMERMSCEQPDSKEDLWICDRRHGDWAFVDGNFLLHFLLYLNHKELNMTEHATADIDNMAELVAENNETKLSHRETCLNLLSWVFHEQGNNNRALYYFRESLKIKPYCNAASFYLAKLPESRGMT